MWYPLVRFFLKCLVVSYEAPLQTFVKTRSPLSPSVSMGGSNIHLFLRVTSFHICIYSGEFFHSITIKSMKKNKACEKATFQLQKPKNLMIHKL